MLPFIYEPSHNQVCDLQRTLHLREITGIIDDETIARLRGWQLARNLSPSGLVDLETAERLGWN